MNGRGATDVRAFADGLYKARLLLVESACGSGLWVGLSCVAGLRA